MSRSENRSCKLLFSLKTMLILFPLALIGISCSTGVVYSSYPDDAGLADSDGESAGDPDGEANVDEDGSTGGDSDGMANADEDGSTGGDPDGMANADQDGSVAGDADEAVDAGTDGDGSALWSTLLPPSKFSCGVIPKYRQIAPPSQPRELI